MHPRPRTALLWTILLGVPACARADTSGARLTQPEVAADEVARLAARQRQLEARIQRLEDRLRLVDGREQAISLSAAGRTEPVRPPATAVAAPPPAAGAAPADGDGEAIGLFRRPVTLGRKTDEPVPGTEDGSDGRAEAISSAAAPAGGSGGASGDEPGVRRSFRLEGRKLVELTKAPPKLAQRSPPQETRRSSGARRKSDDPVISAYHEAMERLRAGDHEVARAAFDRIARRHPRHPYADNALYWKGEAAYDAGDYEAALADFTAVVERYAGGNKAPDALLKIALCYQRLGRTAEAVELLTELIEAYPRAHASDVARIKLVEIRG